MQNPPQFVPLTETWTDYDGDESYGDYTVSGGEVTNAQSFELGLASVIPWTAAGGASTSYLHNDLIGTLRDASGLPGTSGVPRVFTAFGEPVSGPMERYGYAGSWGYQAHDELPYLHVGARYYDPSSGRFLQRDPIGLSGAIALYQYTDGSPTQSIDPTGHSTLDIKVIYPSKPKLPKVRIPWRVACASAANIAGLGTLGLLVVQLIVVPAIDAHTEYRERKAEKGLGEPFNPKDPWGWTERTPGAESWRHKKNARRGAS
jgi:RHS repeat-associated protein